MRPLISTFRKHGSVVILAALMVGGGPTAAPAQNTAPAPLDNDRLLAAYKQSIDDVRHGRYMQATFGLLARLDLPDADRIPDADVFDQWSQAMSCMTGRPRFNPAKTAADYHLAPGDIPALEAATGVPAIPAIVERARHTRIVILDENHLDPRGRAFALEVARALRPLGYTLLAAETLTRDADDAVSQAKMDQLSRDGYLRRTSGYYTSDPVFADFLRQSLALGYHLVSYESARPSWDNEEQRDEDQAENLARRALQAHPGAKLLIYAGEHHAAERPIAAEGNGVVWMAAKLKHLTGIDPLTIDQAGLTPFPMNRPDADLYTLAAPKAQAGSVVLMRQGRPLTVGLLAGAVDLQVVHPPVADRQGRPDWLAGMGRAPVPVPAFLLPASGTRLVQAFLANEAEDAVPVDQVLVTAGQAAPTLMLPARTVRYAVQDWPSP